MKTIKEINKQIEELNKQLKNVQGTKIEVYTRIVGYYRAIKNWNPGRRAEYNDRLTFKTRIPDDKK